MMRIVKFLAHILAFCFLTLLTQVGGMVYILCVLVAWRWESRWHWKFIALFVMVYLFVTFLVVPPLAQQFGRERIQHTERIKPTFYLTVIFNRNYVTPSLNTLLSEAESQLQNVNKPIEIRYLDANFPFLDRFPLFPHLSHYDGKKLDISLVYQTPDGQITNQKKSISGYGVFEEPRSDEFNQTNDCLSKGYFQYDKTKFLTLGSINHELIFSKEGTRTLLNALLQSNKVEKILIEPHLKKRLNIMDNRIRFHGCQAVRHDDHIHVQVR